MVGVKFPFPHLPLNIVMFCYLAAPTLHELHMGLSVPSFLHQKMGADGLPLALQGSVNINEVMGMFHDPSSCQSETADRKRQ